MIFTDLVDLYGLVWSFDLPKLCIKCLWMSFQNELHVLTTCWMRVDLPHESLHEFWHMFTHDLVLTLVDVPWDFELLEIIYQFNLIFSFMCDSSFTSFL